MEKSTIITEKANKSLLEANNYYSSKEYSNSTPLPSGYKEKEMEHLSAISNSTCYLLNKTAFCFIMIELFEHQLRVIQNVRRLLVNASDLKKIFEKKLKLEVSEIQLRKERLCEEYFELDKNISLKEDCKDQKIFDEQIEILKKNTSEHDSDKFDDKIKNSFYLAQKFLSDNKNDIVSINKTEIQPEIIEKICSRLRGIHGFSSNHHVDFYKEPILLAMYLILEHVSDVLAIGDKKGEYFDDFYEKFVGGYFKNFSELNDEGIRAVYNLFKEVYNIIPKDIEIIKNSEIITSKDWKSILSYNLNPGVEISKEQAEKIIKIKNDKDESLCGESKKLLEPVFAPIRKQLKDSIIYEPINDEFEKCNKEIRTLCDNILRLLVDKWGKAEKTSEAREPIIEYNKYLTFYKRDCFNKDFDLKNELIEEINKKEDENTKLLIVSSLIAAIIRTTDEKIKFDSFIMSIDSEVSKLYIKKNLEEIKNNIKIILNTEKEHAMFFGERSNEKLNIFVNSNHEDRFLG